MRPAWPEGPNAEWDLWTAKCDYRTTLTTPAQIHWGIKSHSSMVCLCILTDGDQEAFLPVSPADQKGCPHLFHHDWPFFSPSHGLPPWNSPRGQLLSLQRPPGSSRIAPSFLECHLLRKSGVFPDPYQGPEIWNYFWDVWPGGVWRSRYGHFMEWWTELLLWRKRLFIIFYRFCRQGYFHWLVCWYIFNRACP